MSKEISLGDEIDIFGRNIYVHRLEKYFTIRSIITSEAQTSNLSNSNDIPLVVAASGRINQAMAEAQRYRTNPVHITEIMRRWPTQFGDLLFNENGRELFEKRKNAVQRVANLFADTESKECFLRLVNFRSDYDLKHIKDLSDKQERQYFEPFLPKKISGCFIDIGAFDGWTSKYFRKFYGECNQIIMMEPDENNLRTLTQENNEIENSLILPFGAGLTSETVSFNSAGSASSFNEGGSDTIRLEPLDRLINTKVGMIKLDIEGGELSAIQGAARLIREQRPVIACGCYHSPSQMTEIPLLISSFGLDYKYFFRHYSESIYESVFFAVPI